MVDIPTLIQTVSVVITALSVALGIGIGVSRLRNLVKTRQIQLYMELYNKVMELARA